MNVDREKCLRNGSEGTIKSKAEEIKKEAFKEHEKK